MIFVLLAVCLCGCADVTVERPEQVADLSPEQTPEPAKAKEIYSDNVSRELFNVIRFVKDENEKRDNDDIIVVELKMSLTAKLIKLWRWATPAPQRL